jgi:hypothetical protein
MGALTLMALLIAAQAPAAAAQPATAPTAAVQLSQQTDEFEGEQLAAKVALDGQPMEGVTVEFSTPRLFGTMVLGEAETNGEGLAAIAFPVGLPGDPTTGRLAVTARVVRSDKVCGEDTKTLEGGEKLSQLKDPFPREIWSNRADLHLLLTIPVLIGTVWSVYVFALSQLIRIFRQRPRGSAGAAPAP